MPSTQLSIKIQAILPSKNYTQKQFNNVIDGLRTYMKGPLTRRMKLEFGKTIKNWNHAPSFIVAYSEPYGGARLQLWTKPAGRYSLNWSRVSLGTKERVITSTKGLMTFNVGYDAKTQPGGQYGGTGRRFGEVKFGFRSVGNKKRHRIRPRKFSEQIKKTVEKDIQNDVQKIAQKAIR